MLPSIVYTNLSLVLPLLNAESYYMRNAVVTAAACIIEADFKNQNQQDSEMRVLSTSSRDILFNMMEERIHDINSFARSHVLKTWHGLCEQGAIPLKHLKSVTHLTVDRLHDKASTVRKSSIQLLSLLLECNPYMGNLQRKFYVDKLKHLECEMNAQKQEIVDKAEKHVDRRLSVLSIEGRLQGKMVF